MKILNKNDYELLENLVTMTENELRQTLVSNLKRNYKQVKVTPDYIYAIGDIPVALVAHMDTVFKAPPKEVFYDTRKNVMWSPTGAGFDDRAGIYAILQIIKDGLRPHVIFTTGEEQGGIGASALSHEPCPFKDLKFMIQIDRRGTNDCVFYDCENLEFVNYIENFGFTEAYGSFTDICWLCPEWKVAGVNLSTGYRDEHSSSEVLFVQALLSTIQKVKNILIQKDIPFFKYIPSIYTWRYSYGKYGNMYDFYDDKYDDYYLGDYRGFSDYDCICVNCGTYHDPYDLLEVQMKDGTIGNMCIDCIEKIGAFCVMCDKPFEKDEEHLDDLCPECRRKEAKHARIPKYSK